MTMLAWSAGLAVVAGLALLLLRRRLAVVVVSGVSMEPAFHASDRLLVRRAGLSRLAVGDIVVFARPRRYDGEELLPVEDRWMVKRVAALPGDPVPDAVLPAVAEQRVAEGRLVVLGDNPAASYDSRQFGFLPADLLLGVVLRRMS
ncbi:S26 family signal peptidase [Microbispora sp. NPDC046973]|uniref:S26 family signal peptidase n=1 Tax=Microbispora sp. NPDC046973 TaxID=3155022 RepID=UPI0033CDBD70